MTLESSTLTPIVESLQPSSEPQVYQLSHTGFIGKSVAARLGGIGSNVIMPISKRNLRHYEHAKELKVAGHTSN